MYVSVQAVFLRSGSADKITAAPCPQQKPTEKPKSALRAKYPVLRNENPLLRAKGLKVYSI
jgi:hypothetical protein